MTIKRALIWAAVSTRPQSDEEEKFSIPKQIEDGETMCRDNGWRIMDTLVVPGHSRDYRTLEQLAADARKKDIDAFDRLIAHFQRRDFDIFICRDANRFARKASLLHYIAETIVEDCGALIYSQADNLFVDEENLPMWATIQGYKVRAENKALSKLRNDGMNKLAARGLPTSSHVVASHRIVRDEFGHAIQLEVDPTQVRLWDDVYRLIVEERIPFSQVEIELNKLGHTRKDGKPLHTGYIRQILDAPAFWGHSARFHTRQSGHRFADATWVYDVSAPAPPGVIMHRNMHEAMYKDEKLQRFIAELERRRIVSKGRSRPYRAYRYSGLVVCYGCGYYMTYSGSPPFTYISCRTNTAKHKPCPTTKGVHPTAVEKFVERFVERIQKGEDIHHILGTDDEVATNERRLQLLKDELKTVTVKAQRLVAKQAALSEGLDDIYDDQLNKLGEKRLALESEMAQVEWGAQHNDADQLAAVTEIKALGETFWLKTDTEINVLLTRAMGRRRISAFNGEPVGWVGLPKNTRRLYRE